MKPFGIKGFDYNPYEERIINTLMYSFRPLTTSQVSEYSGISYNTTKDYLEQLKKKGKVKSRVLSNRIYWTL